MRLGVSYNVFDGEELLESSIWSMQDSVDFVCVVYQTKSNYGEVRSDLEPFLEDLMARGLINQLHRYEPHEIDSPLVGEQNEIVKRNIGKDICVQNGCTHHISLDCDEMFDESEFKKAKEFVIENNLETTYVSYDNFYKKPTLKLKTDGFYGYISFIVKCDDRYYGRGKSAVVVDPTRRIDVRKYHIFNRDFIKMYHYGYIRKDEESLRRKLNNSSYRQHHLMIKSIDDVVECYMNHKGVKDVILPWVTGVRPWELEEVKDKLNILYYER